MGEHAALTAAGVAGRPRGAGRAGRRLPPEPRRRLRPGLPRRPDHPVPRSGARPEPARRTPSVEKLAKLKPVFGKGEAATMTAGNSTPLTDGASTVLLASEEWAAQRDLPVLAYLTAYETAAVDYVHGGEGLLMAPAYAMARMLRARACPSRTSTTTRSTRRSPRRCSPRSRPGRTRSSARSASVSTRRSARSTGQAQRQRVVAGGRAPVRRHRRPDRPGAGEAARPRRAPGRASSPSAPRAARASPRSSSAPDGALTHPGDPGLLGPGHTSVKPIRRFIRITAVFSRWWKVRSHR